MRNLKKILALVLALMMTLSLMVTANASNYTDGSKISDDYSEAVEVLTGMGVFQGDNKGQFLPDTTLNRKDAAVLVYRIISGDVEDKYLNNYKGYAAKEFSDVSASAWYEPYVAYAVNGNYIKGDGKGHFNPDADITGTEVLTILLRAVGYDQNGEFSKDWPVTVATLAKQLGVTDTVNGVLLTKAVTREVVAELIFQTIAYVDMVNYTPAFGYQPITLTGNSWNHLGAKETTSLGKKIFGLTQSAQTIIDDWGRPGYYWFDDADKDETLDKTETVYATIAYAPVVTYTTAVTECDVAEDLGISSDKVVTSLYINANKVDEDDFEDYLNGDNKITVLATKATIGEQGRLTEIYKINSKYYVVMIDTFLTTVTDVTEVEYDKNGHIDEYAELTLDVYTKDEPEDGEKIVLTSDEDWSYDVGDVLLIYAATDGAESETLDADAVEDDGIYEILGIAKSMVGAQTAFTTKANTHIVEDETYTDAYQFNLNEAGTSTADHTWYFDTYGNLIGVTDIATKTSYGVISSIYWRDSNDGENGYARATITYMDGTSSTETVYSIAPADDDAKVLEGIEGDSASYEAGEVSSTKQYNKEEFVNRALYSITSSSKGLKLVEVTKLSEEAQVKTGVPNIDADEDTYANATKSTQFLVWNGNSYETYTGIKNVPSYEKGEYYWAAKIGENDITAEYIFILADEMEVESQVTFYANSSDTLTIKSNLKSSGGISYYTITGGYVNGEEGKLYVVAGTENSYKNNAVVSAILNSKGSLLVLDLTDGYVVDVDDITEVTNEAEYLKDDKVYAVYAGNAEDADLSKDGSVLTADSNAYYVEDADVITYNGKSLKQCIENEKYNDGYLYVVYTMSGKTKTAAYVIVTDVELEVSVEVAASSNVDLTGLTDTSAVTSAAVSGSYNLGDTFTVTLTRSGTSNFANGGTFELELANGQTATATGTGEATLDFAFTVEGTVDTTVFSLTRTDV